MEPHFRVDSSKSNLKSVVLLSHPSKMVSIQQYNMKEVLVFNILNDGSDQWSKIENLNLGLVI